MNARILTARLALALCTQLSIREKSITGESTKTRKKKKKKEKEEKQSHLSLNERRKYGPKYLYGAKYAPLAIRAINAPPEITM